MFCLKYRLYGRLEEMQLQSLVRSVHYSCPSLTVVMRDKGKDVAEGGSKLTLCTAVQQLEQPASEALGRSGIEMCVTGEIIRTQRWRYSLSVLKLLLKNC